MPICSAVCASSGRVSQPRDSLTPAAHKCGWSDLTFIGRNGQTKVEHVGGIGEMGSHGIWQLELCQICLVSANVYSQSVLALRRRAARPSPVWRNLLSTISP
jgi:hypothetical protein